MENPLPGALSDPPPFVSISNADVRSQDQAAALGGGRTLPNSEERFHLLSAVLPVGVFYSDAFGHCLYVNKRWQEITGSRIEECLGEGWKNGIDSQDRERVMAEWAARL